MTSTLRGRRLVVLEVPWDDAWSWWPTVLFGWHNVADRAA